MKNLYILLTIALGCSAPQVTDNYVQNNPKPIVEAAKPQPNEIYLRDLSSYLRSVHNRDADPSSLTSLEFCQATIDAWAGARVPEFEQYRAGNGILQHLVDMCLRKNFIYGVDINGDGKVSPADDTDGDNNITDLDRILK